MILELAARGKKTFAAVMLALLYIETVLPMNAVAAARSGGPAKAIVPVPGKKGAAYREHPNNIQGLSAVGNGFAANAIIPVPVKTAPAHRPPPIKMHAEDIGGPGQPETQAFTSVNGDNLVDLFSGDFSYNIPLMDVGGYPIALGYNSGISMDQEPSWVGLGWNVNPGTITRNMRGLPDEFNGADSIRKVQNMKATESWGVNLGAEFELYGTPSKTRRSATDTGFGSLALGIAFTYNNYTGYGIESSISPGLNAGSKTFPGLSGGLSLTNSSTDGLTSGVSFFYQSGYREIGQTNTGAALTASLSGSYNTRAGLKDLQFSVGDRLYRTAANNHKAGGGSGAFQSGISFARQAYTPQITLPYTGIAFSFAAKVGSQLIAYHPYINAAYHHAKQGIASGDTELILPAFGYLNYQNANGKPGSLLDYNIEKEMPYREKPEIPTIGIPAYTYDVFAISGEGTGGMFRAYRGDIGYVYDHQMKTKDGSGSGSIDLGFGQTFHFGADLNLTLASSENGPWKDLNHMASVAPFKPSTGLFEAAYFRNPGETTVNDKTWQDVLGGDDVVVTRLYQSSKSDPEIYAQNILDRYRNDSLKENVTVTNRNSSRTKRDKRTQVISYLTAEEASTAGLSKYIDNYSENKFPLQSCDMSYPSDLDSQGLRGDYYRGQGFNELLFTKTDKVVNYGSTIEFQSSEPAGFDKLNTNFSVRWTGRLKTDVTGRYVFSTRTDDGIRLYLNDSLLINNWTGKPADFEDTAAVNLVAGETYPIVMEYFQKKEKAIAKLQWRFAGQATQAIPTPNLYLESTKTSFKNSTNTIEREKRVNSFRKKNHISEIDVLNADGRRYVYGVPVYNLLQKDLTFSVDANKGDKATGLVGFVSDTDNTINNQLGNDHYFSKEEMPAYPHSWLLSAILSPDYVDLTGDGISPDDPGDAIRFNYSKMASKSAPDKWRIPYNKKANYNQGLQTDNRDDKGSYLYGEKELWYLNSIESKNMIAVFWVSSRTDLPGMDENGNPQAIGQHKKLDSIKLYSKSDYQKDGNNALAIKTVHFRYNYSLCKGVNPNNADGKLTLDSLWFTYNGNAPKVKNAYVFKYNAKNPAYQTNYYDRWGNYKDPSQNPGGINNAEYPYALQDSTLAAQNAAAWTLDSIKLPSGAGMKIDYESDDYAFVQNKRAAQLFRIAGFTAGTPGPSNLPKNELYSLSNEPAYVVINVPQPVSSNQELYSRYLEGMDTLFFKVFVKMPTDKFGSGSEYVTCYATMDPGFYGYYNGGSTIWLKLQTVDKGGNVVPGGYNPVAKAALQFLRMNLPSKAYPGSQTGDNLTPLDGAKMLLSQVTNVSAMLTGFDTDARIRGWAKSFDTTKSFIRLANPYYKKYGGGLRVKRVMVYDNWEKMTKQKQAVYGQEYIYTTTRYVRGVGDSMTISSGVATWEPTIGGEENPWHVPLQYKEQVAVLAPVSTGYVEKPLGEMFYPAPAIGYSKVRVRSLNTKNKRSANGYAETCFYTSYDFPTLTGKTPIGDNKKRFKPTLANLLKIDAKHYMGVSQGFKVELNDMNGKIKSQAVYSESDPNNAISYTENYYHVDDPSATVKHLNNTVIVINDAGLIDATASVGKDVELMMGMRQQRSVTNAYNLNYNTDGWQVSAFLAMLPSLLNIAQREETIFRVVGTTKIVNRHGLLDSVVVKDKGSRVVNRNLVYDGETGGVVLSSTQNEFNDPVFNFSVPAGWAYDGMSGAYKNIGATADNITIREGKIIAGLSDASANNYFTAGDEILAYSHQKTGGTDCDPEVATWAALSRLYVVDANAISDGNPNLFFVTKDGAPFTGNKVTMKITRSGRRNIAAVAGEMTMLNSPLVGDTALVINANSGVIHATATEFSQNWKVADNKKRDSVKSCITQSYALYSKDSCGVHVYGNDSTGAWYKAACGASARISEYVYYHIDRDMYSSTVSQQAANDSAKKALDSLGPIYASRFSPCLYPNKALSRSYTRNNCPSGTMPEDITYTVAYGKYREVTQEQADAEAAADTTANGQAFANANGQCLTCNFFLDKRPGTDELPAFEMIAKNTATGVTYGFGGVIADFPKCKAIPDGTYKLFMAASNPCYAFTSDSVQHTLISAYSDSSFVTHTPINIAMSMVPRIYNDSFSVMVTKNDCGTGLTGSTVAVNIPANTSYSYVSQADAKAKASAYYQSSLQAMANAQGTCLDASHLIVRVPAGKTETPITLTYSTLGGTTTTKSVFTLGPVTYSATISQAMWTITITPQSGYAYVSINGGAAVYFTGSKTWQLSGPPITIDVWK